MKITLKAARVKVGLTQSQVAEKLAVDRTTMVNWESGKTSPTLDNAQRMCRLYGISIADLAEPTERKEMQNDKS